jgi:hypothetical protein
VHHHQTHPAPEYPVPEKQHIYKPGNGSIHEGLASFRKSRSGRINSFPWFEINASFWPYFTLNQQHRNLILANGFDNFMVTKDADLIY